MSGNVNWEGESITIGGFEGVVDDGRLELREEQVQCVRKKGVGEGWHVLPSMALFEEVISDQR